MGGHTHNQLRQRIAQWSDIRILGTYAQGIAPATGVGSPVDSPPAFSFRPTFACLARP